MAFNIGGGISGAVSGGALGSSFGPIGTGIGAIAGGAAGLFGSKKPKKQKAKRVSTFNPQQQQLYKQYVDSLRGSGPFADLYNYNAEGANQNFDANVSRPANRNFRENIVPQITGQFRSGNIQNSSYTGEALSRAGRDVQENLDAQRSNMQFEGQQNANANKINSINSLLNMQTFAYQRPQEKTPGTIDQILGAVAPQAGEWFADYLRNKRSTTSPQQPSIPSGGISSQGRNLFR